MQLKFEEKTYGLNVLDLLSKYLLCEIYVTEIVLPFFFVVEISYASRAIVICLAKMHLFYSQSMLYRVQIHAKSRICPH